MEARGQLAPKKRGIVPLLRFHDKERCKQGQFNQAFTRPTTKNLSMSAAVTRKEKKLHVSFFQAPIFPPVMHAKQFHVSPNT